MMDMDPAGSIIKGAESETFGHLRFMRRSILLDMLFIGILIIVLIANDLTAIAMGLNPGRWDEIKLFLNPPPILFFALMISAVIESYTLLRLKRGLKELSRHAAMEVPSEIGVGKSLTDINYGIIKAMERSLRVWPVVAFLFALYFLESIRNIAEWTTGTLPSLVFNWTTVLNTVTLIFAIVFFWIQTKRWMARRKHLRKLKRMEMTIAEELHI
jgi:hypothetical protein